MKAKYSHVKMCTIIYQWIMHETNQKHRPLPRIDVDAVTQMACRSSAPARVLPRTCRRWCRRWHRRGLIRNLWGLLSSSNLWRWLWLGVCLDPILSLPMKENPGQPDLPMMSFKPLPHLPNWKMWWNLLETNFLRLSICSRWRNLLWPNQVRINQPPNRQKRVQIKLPSFPRKIRRTNMCYLPMFLGEICLVFFNFWNGKWIGFMSWVCMSCSIDPNRLTIENIFSHQLLLDIMILKFGNPLVPKPANQ